MYDPDDKVEVKEEKVGLSPKLNTDEVTELILRRVRLDREKIKVGKGNPQIETRLKEHETAVRKLDFFLTSNPDASINDAYEALMKEQHTLQSSTEIKKGEATLRILGDFVVRLGSQVDRLGDEEKAFVLGLRDEKSESAVEDKEKKEDELIKEVLKEGIYRTYFSCTVQNESGNSVGSTGYNTFYSEKGLQWGGWERNARNVFEFITPDGYYNRDHQSSDVKKVLGDNNVIDAIAFKTPYKRITRKVERVNKTEAVGMFGKRVVRETKESFDEFDHNEPEKYPNSSEAMVRMQYQTLTNSAGGNLDWGNEYTDDNGRPGNMMILDMVLPESIVKKMVKYAANPNFFRKLTEASVFDHEMGIEKTLNRQREFTHYQDHKLTLATHEGQGSSGQIKTDRGIPPYENTFWKNGSMLIDIDYQVPVGDQTRDFIQPWEQTRRSVGKVKSIIQKPNIS